MPRLRSVLLAAGCLVVIGGAAPPSQAAPKQFKGTITWTTTETYGPKTGGSPQEVTTGTAKTQVTLKATFKRRAGAYGFQIENSGSSYSGSYALDRKTEERDIDGNLTCITTSVLNAKGSGKIPKSASSPSLSANILGGPRTGPGGTLVLSANLRYAGEQTTTYAGQGISPCQSGQDTDDVEGSLAPGNDARRVCSPAGAKGKRAVAGDVVGVWKAKKRAFGFACSQKWDDQTNGVSYVQVIAGSIKAA